LPRLNVARYSHVRIASYISTVRKHDLPVFDYLLNALHGRPFLPQGPKST